MPSPKRAPANRAALDQVPERMAAAAAFGGGPAPEILRAMHNLPLALRIRLGRGPLDAAEVRAVTEILDRAAARIESTRQTRKASSSVAAPAVATAGARAALGRLANPLRGSTAVFPAHAAGRC